LTLFDLAVTYKVNPNIAIKVGAENVLDTYPDEAIFQASRGLVDSRNAPYDTNGGNYYVRLDARFETGLSGPDAARPPGFCAGGRAGRSGVSAGLGAGRRPVQCHNRDHSAGERQLGDDGPAGSGGL